MVERVRNLKPGEGLNAATGDYTNMFESGILDPAKVTRSALQNASSIAALFLTTEAVIAESRRRTRPRRATRPAAWAAWTSEVLHFGEPKGAVLRGRPSLS